MMMELPFCHFALEKKKLPQLNDNSGSFRRFVLLRPRNQREGDDDLKSIKCGEKYIIREENFVKSNVYLLSYTCTLTPNLESSSNDKETDLMSKTFSNGISLLNHATTTSKRCPSNEPLYLFSILFFEMMSPISSW